jgi:ribosomal protein L19E
MHGLDSNKKHDDDIDAKMYTPFYCIDCGQEFDSRKELEEHEIKHQSLSKPKE